jgi:hypothetical protein
MSKSVVTRTWLGGLVAIAFGLLIAGVAVGAMLAFGGTFQTAPTGNGYDFVPAQNGAFWTSVSAIVIGGVLATFGGLVQLVAWIGAVINTYQVTDKTWFVVMLVGGVVGLAFGLVGMAVMIAYMIAGPDGTAIPKTEPPVAAGPARLSPAS